MICVLFTWKNSFGISERKTAGLVWPVWDLCDLYVTCKWPVWDLCGTWRLCGCVAVCLCVCVPSKAIKSHQNSYFPIASHKTGWCTLLSATSNQNCMEHKWLLRPAMITSLLANAQAFARRAKVEGYMREKCTSTKPMERYWVVAVLMSFDGLSWPYKEDLKPL